MTDRTYVVYLRETDDPQPFKHFSMLPAARAFANQQVDAGVAERAEIWTVPATDARSAIAVLKVGQGDLLELRAPHATESELQRQREQEWKIAVDRGPEAILKFLGLT